MVLYSVTQRLRHYILRACERNHHRCVTNSCLTFAPQDVAYERRSPARLRRVMAQVEQVPALQNSENGNGTPPELDALKGCSPGTISVHGGERAGRPRVSDSLTTPLVQASSGAAYGGCIRGRQASQHHVRADAACSPSKHIMAGSPASDRSS